ncbi:MAG: SDR family oxidoreductase [Pirellulaceae bacterium]|nr:SDR family oxidoreductase [Pirellulaceae bacterium]
MGCLEGKVAIITGAGGGIGREHALLFAREGAKVVVNDIGCNRDGSGNSDTADRVVAEIRKAGGQAVANSDAVGSFASARSIVQTAVDSFGGLNILVNNAGILRDRTILNMTEEEWNLVIQVHLTGTFSCLQAAARVMKDQGRGGRIINTSSISGLLGLFGQTNYGAAKAGIYNLTRVGAMELAKHKITVNALAPAAMTRMMDSIPGVNEQQAVLSESNYGPQFIAPVAAFLASDAAAHITGQTVGIEGNDLFMYRVMTSHGLTKRANLEPWTIQEIGKSIEQAMYW